MELSYRLIASVVESLVHEASLFNFEIKTIEEFTEYLKECPDAYLNVKDEEK